MHDRLAGYSGGMVPEWLPRVPLGLAACARALLIPGEAGRACTEPLEWPALDWRAPAPAPVPATAGAGVPAS